MTVDNSLKNLAEKVQANQKYQSITQDLVMRLSEEAIRKGLSGKSAVKAVRNKLHQVGGAYFKQNLDYTTAIHELTKLPEQMDTDQVKQYCRKFMRAHASTAERLSILETFYQTTLSSIAPVSSILDLACGMNPLAIPWMPLTDNFSYHACDIYLDMLGLLNQFFNQFKLNASAQPCDLLGEIPNNQAQVAFLLKTIPCLEQMEKTIGLRLLEAIQAEHILVSFPVHSLGGRKKGMPDFYRDHFLEMISQKEWGIQVFTFPTELAFLVTK